jgi:hypothetical protein
VEELRVRIEDLEQEIAATLNRVAACVDAVRTNNADLRYLVVERLPSLGTAVSAPCERIARDETADADVRVAAALVALVVGDTSVSHFVVAEVAKRGPLSLIGSRLIAHHAADGAEAAILQAISESAPSEADNLVAYLSALRMLDLPLPPAERTRLLRDAPWQVTTLIEEAFPAQ